MSVDLERQIIGRAQRLGRMNPLNIHYLCFENEYQNINQAVVSEPIVDLDKIDEPASENSTVAQLVELVRKQKKTVSKSKKSDNQANTSSSSAIDETTESD